MSLTTSFDQYKKQMHAFKAIKSILTHFLRIAIVGHVALHLIHVYKLIHMTKSIGSILIRPVQEQFRDLS